MVEGRGSTLVHVLVVALCLVAFGFAIAAERRRSVVSPLCLTSLTLFPPVYSLLFPSNSINHWSCTISNITSSNLDLYVLDKYFATSFCALLISVVGHFFPARNQG